MEGSTLAGRRLLVGVLLLLLLEDFFFFRLRRERVGLVFWLVVVVWLLLLDAGDFSVVDGGEDIVALVLAVKEVSTFAEDSDSVVELMGDPGNVMAVVTSDEADAALLLVCCCILVSFSKGASSSGDAGCSCCSAGCRCCACSYSSARSLDTTPKAG